MKLNFQGDLKGLEKGINILKERLGFEISDDGLNIKVEKISGFLEVSKSEGKGNIKYEHKIHFFRALGLFIEALQKGSSFNIVEYPQFSTSGVMIDMSRNSVMKVESLKRTIELMAIMGLNMLMLYTEDTYTIEGRPYFGYMRGRYTYEELKECDDYANMFGIEMIPCIQTLAHLQAALKWESFSELRDTEDILLVGSEKTYEFVEEMIKSASAPFRSKRIHIGMDEAHYIGLGRYLDINGYKKRFDILNEHLAKVREIVNKYGLKAMIWSDMYFRLASKTRDYYDFEAEIPMDTIKKVPSDMQLVYWDYYHDKEDIYLKMIKEHKRFNNDILFAGGIWTWNGVGINYQKTFDTTNTGLAVCKKEGIKEVFATIWGDDGAETNFFTALLGLQLFAEHSYSKNLDSEKLKRRFKFCTGVESSIFMDLTLFDSIPGVKSKDVLTPPNPSKFLLWQDILLGLFDKDVESIDFPAYYSDLTKKISRNKDFSMEWRFIFDLYAKMAEVLSIKSHLGIRIKEAYDKNDLTLLSEIAGSVLPELRQKISELKELHREQWLKIYKAFGWEILDIRYGGLLSRIETVIKRLSDYINGKVEKLEELEEKRLPFIRAEEQKEKFLIGFNKYIRIVSGSNL